MSDGLASSQQPESRQQQAEARQLWLVDHQRAQSSQAQSKAENLPAPAHPAGRPGVEQLSQPFGAEQGQRRPEQVAVPGQLGAERQHQGGTAEEQPQFPAPGAVVALPPGPVQTDGQQQQPGPTTLQHLHPWGPPAVAIADAAGDPGQSLAAPHQQRIVAAHTPVPEMPAQPGQQSQAEADPAAPARPAVAAAHNQGDQAQPQQCRWFQQQHATAGDPCAQSSQGMLTGSDPAPPQQQAATHQRAVQHRQPAVTGHGQQGHQHHPRQQGPAVPVGTVELPAH